jgi:hypothetical protein
MGPPNKHEQRFFLKKTTVRFFRVQKIWGLYIGQKLYFSPSICQYIYSLRTIFLPLFLSILLFYFTLQVPLIFLLRSPPPPLPSNINRYFPPPVFSKIHLHPCRKFCQLSNIFTLLSEQVPRRRKSSTSYRNRCTSITFCSSLSPCNSSAQGCGSGRIRNYLHVRIRIQVQSFSNIWWYGSN